jgi:hypothetical protein
MLINATLDVIVDGRALAAQYVFGTQEEGLERTDVFQRYKAFAREFCGLQS